jgi:hypothetical protein
MQAPEIPSSMAQKRSVANSCHRSVTEIFNSQVSNESMIGMIHPTNARTGTPFNIEHTNRAVLFLLLPYKLLPEEKCPPS